MTGHVLEGTTSARRPVVKHVGMDLGKRQSHACTRGPDGKVRHARIKTTREGLTDLLGSGGGRLLLEASTTSEWVARHAESLGWEVVVADPNYAPMYAERSRQVKTDRRDAEALLMACEKGTYRPAHRLSDAARQARTKAQVRKVFVRMRARAIVQAKSRMSILGLSDIAASPRGFAARWKKQEFPPELAEEMNILKPLVEMAGLLSERIADCDEQLERLSEEVPEMALLMSMPGIGPVTAATWLATLDTPERFEAAENVASYLGLVAREWSSSERRYQGSITKKGPSELRSLLVEAAWTVLSGRAGKADPLRTWGLQVAKRRGNKIAVVALARKMCLILYVMWREKVTYDPRKVGVQLAKTSRD